MALFEIIKENYYHGMWRANFAKGDFMALLWLENGEWIFRYRLRYFKDDKVWESDDMRSAHQVVAKDGPGQQEHMYRGVQAVIDTLMDTGKITNVEYYPCNGDGEAMLKLMQSGIPGIHCKRMTKEQYEEYVRTNQLPEGVE